MIKIRVNDKFIVPGTIRPHQSRQFHQQVIEALVDHMWRPAEIDPGAGNPEQYVYLTPENTTAIWEKTYFYNCVTRYVKPFESSAEDPFTIQVLLATEWRDTSLIGSSLVVTEPEMVLGQRW